MFEHFVHIGLGVPAVLAHIVLAVLVHRLEDGGVDQGGDLLGLNCSQLLVVLHLGLLVCPQSEQPA